MRLNEVINFYKLTNKPDELSHQDLRAEMSMTPAQYEKLIVVPKAIQLGGFRDPYRIQFRTFADSSVECWEFLNYHLRRQKKYIPVVKLRQAGQWDDHHMEYELRKMTFQIPFHNFVFNVVATESHYGDFLLEKEAFNLLKNALKQTDPRKREMYGQWKTWKTPRFPDVKPILK